METWIDLNTATNDVQLYHIFIVSAKSHRFYIRSFSCAVNLKKNISWEEWILTRKSKKKHDMKGILKNCICTTTVYKHLQSHTHTHTAFLIDAFFLSTFPPQLQTEHTVNDVWNMHFRLSKIQFWVHERRHVCLLSNLILYQMLVRSHRWNSNLAFCNIRSIDRCFTYSCIYK